MNEGLFPVKEVPAIGVPKEANTKEIDDTGYKFIVREDTGTVLSCMTNKYQLITNNEVYDTVSPILKEYEAVPVETRVFSEGARTTWKWKFPDIEVNIGDGDLVNPEMTIRNSYDGTYEASAIAGAFRIVCSNGLIIGYMLGKSGLRHIMGMDKSKFYKLVEDTIKKTKIVFNDEFPKIANTKVKQRHIENVVKLFPTGEIMEALVTNLIGKPPKTYWDLLNSATWVATHAMNRNNEATHKLESKIYPMIRKFAIAEA